MARSPIHLEMAGMQTPRERMWAAMRKLRKCTCMQVQEAAGSPFINLQTIQDYLLALENALYLERLNKQGHDARAKYSEVHFKLVKDSFEAPRLNKSGGKVTQGTATLAMWRAMKALKEFDYKEVKNAASLGNLCIVTDQTAKSYVVLLARAGYFRTLREGKPGMPARYRLVRDTGAHAPAITRRKAVFDRNKGEFTWQQPEQEVCNGLE
jgi:hypothetical protein